MAKSTQTSEIHRLEETPAEVKLELANKQREFGTGGAIVRRKRVFYFFPFE